jgi:hypothetical protein
MTPIARTGEEHAMPTLVIDNVPAPLYDQIERLALARKRIASLVSPYREHLAQHFAVTYMRVALPEPYTTQP